MARSLRFGSASGTAAPSSLKCATHRALYPVGFVQLNQEELRRRFALGVALHCATSLEQKTQFEWGG